MPLNVIDNASDKSMKLTFCIGNVSVFIIRCDLSKCTYATAIHVVVAIKFYLNGTIFHLSTSPWYAKVFSKCGDCRIDLNYKVNDCTIEKSGQTKNFACDSRFE